MAIKEINQGYNFYEDLEGIDRDRREEILFNSISGNILKIAKSAPGWKEILQNVDISQINSRDDLKKIPITRKSNLTNIQTKNFPYGNLTTKDATEFEYMFASPGPIYEPGERGDFWHMSRSLFAAGFRAKEVAYNTFSYHLGPAGIMMGNAVNNLDGVVIAGGVGNTELQINTICNLRPSFYLGTPSFLKLLIDKADEKEIDIKSLKRGLVGAEPFPPSLREFFSEKEINVLQMYGIAEVGCIAYETKDHNNKNIPGMIIEENIILEIVRPGTNEPLPAGEVGEVVVTKINSNYPMLRLATGDLSSVIDEISPCGRTNFRIKGWMGRAEQSTKIKGLFITPLQINAVMKKFKELKKVKLVVTNEKLVDNPMLICEAENNFENLEKEIKEFFKASNKLTVNVSLVMPGEIKNDGLVIEDKRVYD